MTRGSETSWSRSTPMDLLQECDVAHPHVGGHHRQLALALPWVGRREAPNVPGDLRRGRARDRTVKVTPTTLRDPPRKSHDMH
eukprot:572615-Pyramimonas_sp.AAC.1